MTPPDDVSERIEDIRERYTGPNITHRQGFNGGAQADVNDLLAILDQVGEALAATDARTVFAFLDRVEEDAGTDLMRALGQVRDVALKRDYETEVEADD